MDLIAEELFGREFRDAHADDHHGEGRGHAAAVGDDLLQFLDGVHIEDIDLRDEKEDKADERRDGAGLRDGFLDRDLFFILGDEVGAERPNRYTYR